LGLSKEKFSSTSINKDTYGGYIPSSSSSNSSRRGQVRSTSLPPTASSSTASSNDVLNDSTASNISFASSNVSNDAEGEPNTDEELLIHEKKSTVEEKTVKRVPRESREHLPGTIEPVFGAGGPSRPKPLYTSYSSSLDKPQGIEFNASEAREEYDKASQLSNFRRSRDASMNHLRESTMEKFRGIEERESEYRKRYDPIMILKTSNGPMSPSKPKPSWYSWDEERSIF